MHNILAWEPQDQAKNIPLVFPSSQIKIWGKLNDPKAITSEEKRNLENFSNAWVFGKFPRDLGYLVNFSDTQALWKFPKFPKFLSFHFRVVYFSDFENFSNDRNLRLSQIARHLENFPDTHHTIPIWNWGISEILLKRKAFGKFPRYPGIWEIPEIFWIPIGIWGWYVCWWIWYSSLDFYI